MTKPKMLSPREVALYQKTSLDWIYRQVWSGKFPGAQKVGKRWLIPAAALTKKGETHAGEQDPGR